MESERKEIREMLREFTENYIRNGNLWSDFSKLSPKDRVGNMIKLLPYFTMKETGKEKDLNSGDSRHAIYLPSLFPEIDNFS